MQYSNVVFPDSIGFQCRQCGSCCRAQPPDVSLKEQEIIESKGFINFLEDYDSAKNRDIRKNKNGSCFFLTTENTCKIQEVKPAICRLDPFVIADYDCETGTIFLDLNPAAVKSCKGISFGELIAPEEICKVANSIVNEFLEIVSKKTGLPITNKRVASIVRRLLID
jgi:Fe-S-cluster containining protein